MSEVTSIPPETPAGVPVGTSVVGVDLRDLDDRGVLAAVGDARRHVDRALAVAAARNTVPRNLSGLIHEALQRCDPDAAAGREQAALERRGVSFTHRDSTATSAMTATLDTPDALDLDATLTQLAAQL